MRMRGGYGTGGEGGRMVIVKGGERVADVFGGGGGRGGVSFLLGEGDGRCYDGQASDFMGFGGVK